MKPSLSIIIPCYNCDKTLGEAVASCFRQGLENFEIVMVDDCSTDGTKALMNALAKQHPEIRLAYHAENKGGGAARNTAVAKTQGDVIFCLDSDDILGDGTLSKMLAYLHKNSCDGVGVATSIKFKGTNTKDIAFINNFSRIGEKILFTDLFETEKASCSLYSVFMHTKKAFEIAGGYPTDHGFDTQAFAFRFLANGLVAHTCPDTTYLHRVNFNTSYYLREYESGKANHNWFKVYDEFLYLFNDETKQKILSYDLNNAPEALNSFIRKEQDILAPNYNQFITPHSKKIFTEALSSKNPADLGSFDLYWLGSEALRNKDMEKALSYLTKSVQAGLTYPIVLVKIAATGLPAVGISADEIAKAVKSFYSYKTQGSRSPILRRIVRKIKHILRL